MKTKPLNSPKSPKSFSGTFSIYALVKNVEKNLRTLRNPSELPNYSGLRAEELKTNPSNPSGSQKALGLGCSGCGNKNYTQHEMWTSHRLPEGAWEWEHTLLNGWKCDQCGSEFLYIGGTRGPQLIN